MQITIIPPSGPVATLQAQSDLVEAFLSGRNSKTIRAYRQDLRDFQAFTWSASLDDAAQLLLAHGPGAANSVALAYRGHLLNRSLATASINRRLAALRSLVKLARMLGRVTWSLEVGNLKSTAYRDTAGPGIHGFMAMLGHLEDHQTPKALRDRAIMRLLFNLALRRGEVVSLDLCHFDQQAGRLAILGKGRTEREFITVPPKTFQALQDWVLVRGEDPGPLFCSVDRAHAGHRLDGGSIHRIVANLGKAVGITTRPHGLRHAGITAGLDQTNGDTRSVRRFSRHRSLNTLGLYDDNRQDLGGQVAAMLDSIS